MKNQCAHYKSYNFKFFEKKGVKNGKAKGKATPN